MSTVRTPRDRRQPVPSSRLTTDSNAAQPALKSHRHIIALAQAKKAAEAESDPSRNLTALSASSNNHQQRPDLEDVNQSLPSTSAPSPVPSFTPTTTSQAGSIVPPATDHGSDSGHSSIASSTARKKKRTKKRNRTQRSGM
jgi:outer membrane protein TolC